MSIPYFDTFQPFKYIIIQNVETSKLPVEHIFCKWEFLTAKSFCISETTLLNLGKEDIIISSRVEPINRITIYLQSWEPSDIQLLCNFCLHVRCCNLYYEKLKFKVEMLPIRILEKCDNWHQSLTHPYLLHFLGFQNKLVLSNISYNSGL